jgi:hypothetical protein
VRLTVASAVTIACLVVPSAAVAQVAGADSRSVFELSIVSRFPGPFLVSEVDPKGTAKVVNQGFPNRAIPLIEGYYLMVVKADDPAGLPRLFRVQVSDVGFKLLTLQVGEESARGLRAGEHFDLWRPEGSTTAQLRGLPPVIPVARDKEYDFSQPWDGEKNRALLARMPDVYRDAIRQDDPGQFTDYAALVGEGSVSRGKKLGSRGQTVFSPEGLTMTDAGTLPLARPAGAAPPQGVVRLSMITDGSTNTAIVATVSPGRKIPWTKPEDITFGPDFPLALEQPGGIAAPYVVGEASDTHRAALLLFADGAARAITDRIRPDVLLALLTRNGGEVINWGQGANSFAVPNDAELRPWLMLDCNKGQATVVNKMFGRGPRR